MFWWMLQANLSPAEAAALWSTVKSEAGTLGAEIVSPAVNFCGGDCTEEVRAFIFIHRLGRRRSVGRPLVADSGSFIEYVLSSLRPPRCNGAAQCFRALSMTEMRVTYHPTPTPSRVLCPLAHTVTPAAEPVQVAGRLLRCMRRH